MIETKVLIVGPLSRDYKLLFLVVSPKIVFFLCGRAKAMNSCPGVGCFV